MQEKLKGKCALNSVISICPTNNASEIRPNEEITINVTKMRFSDNSEDLANIKWALNGKVVQEGGRTYKFSNDKEGIYYIEAFSLKSNSLTIPDEKDTWKLTITENEVKDISAEGMPRVGKPFTLTAKTIFPDLSDKDLKNLKWDIPFSYIDENGIEHKPFEKHFQIKGMGLGSPKDPRTKIIIPSVEGEFEVTCSINKKTIKNKINIVRPTISSPHWIDKDGSSGNILATAGYDQEMYAYIKHLGLDGEEVVVEVYDAKDKKNPIFTSEKITVPVGSKEFTFHYSVKKVFKGKTEEEKKEEDRNRKDFQIFFKVKPIDNKLLKESLNEEFENNLLTITNKGDIVEAYFCNSDDTEKRKFIESGKVAHLKIYATNMKNREVEVLFFTRDKFHYPKNTTQNELTWKLWSEIKTHNIKGEPFHSTKGKINDKGELLVELDTSKYKWIKGYIIAVFKIKGKEGKEKGAFIKEWYSLILHSYPQLTKLAENKATVKVGGLLGIGKVERVQLEESCKGKYCITKGNYKEKKAEKLIQELNIRLAGFGGNVPSEEFTDRTEMMIRQFERDYMKVPETGKICGNLLRAVDEFCSNPSYNFDFNQTKCSCTTGKYKNKKDNPLCNGYGNGRENEFPGMHRSLLFSLKALLFYLSKDNSEFSLLSIFSGYRCWSDNNDASRHDNGKTRKSTNHMGCALDLHFKKNGIRTSSVKDMERIRKDFFNKYMNAPYEILGEEVFFGWKKDHIGLEPKKFKSGQQGATSWVHYDVRDFSSKYKNDKFFIKNISELIPTTMINLAQELGLSTTCSCKKTIAPTSKLESNCQKCTILDKTRMDFYKEFGTSAIEMVKKKGKSNKFKGLYMVAQRRQENSFKINVPNNNPMNIKGKGDIGVSPLKTHEYIRGKRVDMVDNFANFSTVEKGFEGYLSLLEKNFHYAYEAVLDDSKTIDDFLTGLQDKGRIGAYATAPDYKSGVKNIFNGVVKDYKKWLNCKLQCPSHVSEIESIKEDLELLEKLK